MALLVFALEERDSVLRRINPGLKLLALILCSIILSSHLLLSLSLLLALIVISASIQKINLFKKLLASPFFLVLALLILVTDYLNSKDLFQSSINALSFITLILLSLLFTSVTSPDECARSIERILRPMLGRFATTLSSVVELTLSLLPVIFNAATISLDSRRCRGQSFLKHPIKATSGYVIFLINILLQKVEEKADALLARSYQGVRNTKGNKLVLSDYLFIMVLLLIVGVWYYDKTRA